MKPMTPKNINILEIFVSPVIVLCPFFQQVYPIYASHIIYKPNNIISNDLPVNRKLYIYYIKYFSLI